MPSSLPRSSLWSALGVADFARMFLLTGAVAFPAKKPWQNRAAKERLTASDGAPVDTAYDERTWLRLASSREVRSNVHTLATAHEIPSILSGRLLDIQTAVTAWSPAC